MGVRAPETPAPQALTPAGMDAAPAPHLKMKMKSISSMQKVATLSMVFMSTTSCRCSADQEAHQLQHPHQAEGPQHRQAAPAGPRSPRCKGRGWGRSQSLGLRPLHAHLPPTPTGRRRSWGSWPGQHEKVGSEGNLGL